MKNLYNNYSKSEATYILCFLYEIYTPLVSFA